MKIKLASAFVDDQDNALKFYTDVLGLGGLKPGFPQ
jgi:catechol 2,3-dioxygenase-like lactoylglutathione lyase family enzyme